MHVISVNNLIIIIKAINLIIIFLVLKYMLKLTINNLNDNKCYTIIIVIIQQVFTKVNDKKL